MSEKSQDTLQQQPNSQIQETPSLEGVLCSIETYLNPEIFDNEKLVQQIARHLGDGKLVVIRKALKEAFAERLFTCLDQFSDWGVYEKYEEGFHYHHHNIYDVKLFPPDLMWCGQVFQSDSTKKFIQRLSQRDCGGKTQFSASWYLPGDHSLPHNDLITRDNECRQVAFIWHLTKNWQHNWGGDLFWCPRTLYVPPSFNTLLLFNVGRNSHHFVTQVSPYAQSKRLAINGWWTGMENDGERPTHDHNRLISGGPLIEAI